jgi:hypothetical protein
LQGRIGDAFRNNICEVLNQFGMSVLEMPNNVINEGRVVMAQTEVGPSDLSIAQSSWVEDDGGANGRIKHCK